LTFQTMANEAHSDNMDATGPSFDAELDRLLPEDASMTAEEPVELATADGGHVFALAPSPAASDRRRYRLVGRQAATADLRIAHGSISRKHALLFYSSSGDSQLLDLGGPHGCHVNNERIGAKVATKLRVGDVIQFGNVRDSIFIVKAMKKIKEKEDIHADPVVALSGRDQRRAEIAAMMASLDEAPSYQKYTPTLEESVPDTPEMMTTLQMDNEVLRQARDEYRLPVTETLILPAEAADGRQHAVTCLAMDPAGSRLVVGSTDTTLRFYDFGGMHAASHRPFFTSIPDDGHLLVSVSYSPSGDKLLMGTSSVQPRVLDREGAHIITMVRGDMYVTDPARTAGHTAACTAVSWHPLDASTVLTAARDGSVRLWNIVAGRRQFEMLVCDQVCTVKTARGQRAQVTCAVYCPHGRQFAVGTACGSIQLWQPRALTAPRGTSPVAVVRPIRVVYNAHGGGDSNRPVTSLSWYGSRLVSRSAADSTVRVWDAARLSLTWTGEGVPHGHEAANAVFSPDGQLVVVACHPDGTGQGALWFFDQSSPDPIFKMDSGAGVVPVTVYWHSKLNQIVVGCANGQVLVYYDRKLSTNGALLVARKGSRNADVLGELIRTKQPTVGTVGDIVNPLVQPKRPKRKAADQDQQTTNPARPVGGGKKAGSQFAQYVADQRMAKSKSIAGRDPREALFQYNEGKSYVADAYLGNKERILADTTIEAEQEDEKEE
jgi:WD repeat-containing protein 70